MGASSRRIPRALHRDARPTEAEPAEVVGLSPLPDPGAAAGAGGRCPGPCRRPRPGRALPGTVAIGARTGSQDAETRRHPEQAVATMPEVIEAWPATGRYDAAIRAAVGGTAGYEQPQAERIRRLPGLHHTRAGFAPRRPEQQGRTPAP